MSSIYVDHAATTPVRPEAIAAMEPFLGPSFGNPSGLHGVSRRAKNAIEEARERAAGLLGASRPLEIVFAGGGTEADNLAVKGAALAGGGRRGVVTTAIEHEAVLSSCEFLAKLGCPVDIVPVGSDGVVDPADVLAAITPETAVVSVMAANNETGIRQPVAEIAAAAGVPVHTDAVQAFVSTDVSVAALGADLITLAAHKFGGPQGTGLLFVRDGIALEPAIHGGGQELGRRSGTHNVAGIVGMVAAMEAAATDRQSFRTRVAAIRDAFEARLAELVPDVEFTAPDADRLVQHSHFRMPGKSAETVLINLDGRGVAAAAGSACHSGAIEVSHVLAAMGMDPQRASECVRVTFGWDSAADDGVAVAEAVAEAAR